MSGRNSLFQFAPSSDGVQTSSYSDGRPILTFYGENNQTEPIDARDFGVVANGVVDDTSALQTALTALGNQGNARLVIPGPCLISQTLVSTGGDNIEVVGNSWASQLIAAAGFPAGPMLQFQAVGGGVFRYGIRVADLFLNGSNVAGVGGLDLQTTYAARVDHVRIRFCKGIGIHMNGSSGNTGAYNHILGCHITDGGAGVGIQTDFSEWLTVEGGLISFYNQAGGIGAKCGNLNCRWLGVGFDNNDTALQLEFAGRNTVMGCQFDRGQTRFIYMHGTQYATITGNSFNSYNGTTQTGAIDVTDANNAGNVIADNALRGGSGWTNFIYEHGTVGAPNNTYANNDTGGSAIVLVSGATAGTTRGNRGYNPRGANVTQLAIAATGVALTNTTGCDCMLQIAGGTVTQVAIGGVNTGLTSGWFRVPAQQTVTVTYSVAPTTFQWLGD